MIAINKDKIAIVTSSLFADKFDIVRATGEVTDEWFRASFWFKGAWTGGTRAIGRREVVAVFPADMNPAELETFVEWRSEVRDNEIEQAKLRCKEAMRARAEAIRIVG